MMSTRIARSRIARAALCIVVAATIIPAASTSTATAAGGGGTIGVYPGFDQGGRFAAFERDLDANVSWVVAMAGRLSPHDMRSSVWGQVTKPTAFLPKVANRVNLVMSVPLAFGTRTAKNDANRRLIGQDLRAVAAGRHDSDYRQVARSLIEGGYPDAVIRLGHEFDGDYYSWSARDNEAAYIAAFRHVHDVFASESNGFRFEWTGMRNTFKRFAPAAYPGDGYVDIVGLDIYYRDAAPMSSAVWSKQYEPALEFHRNFAAAHGKPVSFPEWGVGNFDHPEFIEAMNRWFNGLPTSGAGRLLYQSYFTPGRAAHNLDKYPKSKRAYFSLFGGRAGSASSPSTLDPTPKAPTPTPPATTPPATTPPSTSPPVEPGRGLAGPESQSPAELAPAERLSVSAAQFTMFDQRVVHGATSPAELNFSVPPSWSNFAQGTPLLRLDIVNKPSSLPVEVLVCMWQQGFAKETCNSAGTYTSAGSNWVQLKSPASWWRRSGWNWSRPIDHVRLVVKDPKSNTLLLSSNCGSACYRGSGTAAQHNPIAFDAEMVIVADGAQLTPPASWNGCPTAFLARCAGAPAQSALGTSAPAAPPVTAPPAGRTTATPTVSIRQAAAPEGKNLGFKISLSAPAPSPVTVRVNTRNGSARAGSDYRRRSTSVVIPAGQQTAWVGVVTIKDRRREGAESMTMRISGANGATVAQRTATGTIRDR